MTTEYTLPIMELVKIPVLTRSIFFAPTFCPAYVAIVEPSASNGQQQNMEILPAAVTDATKAVDSGLQNNTSDRGD